MPEIVKNYQLSKISSNNYKRIINKIRKIKEIKSASIDKEQDILRVQIILKANERASSKRIEKIEEGITKSILEYEKKATIEEIVYKEMYRKVLYLNGLDCAHCAAKIEDLAKKSLNYEKLLVDYTSFRFIIESSDKEQMDNIINLVSNIAHKVDDRIVVTEKEKIEKEDHTPESNQKKLFRIAMILLGITTGVIGMLFFMEFDIRNIVNILHHDDLYIHEIFANHENMDYTRQAVHVILMIVTWVILGYPIIIRFLKNIVKGKIFDENCLMTLASIGAIATSHYIEAIFVVSLFQIGEYLQKRAVNKCRKSIEELLKFDVKTARLKKGNELVDVDVESVIPDDIIVINKGEMVPLDCVLMDQKRIIDTKNLTGESIHREISRGEVIMAGSVNMSDVMDAKVVRPYSESMITKILDMVENASTSKAKAENFITKFCKIYTPLVLLCAVVIGFGGYFIETLIYMSPSLDSMFEWIYRAMVFLVISCPCALVISIPLCFFMGIGFSSKKGILIKGSNYLEALNNVENIVFDKTGTLTKGEFKIKEVVTATPEIKKDDLLRNIMYVEYFSSHPIGISIVEEYGRDNIFTEIISDFESLVGGAQAYINGNKVIVGNYRLMKNLKLEVPQIDADGLVLYVYKEKTYLGYVVIGDTIKEEAKDTVNALRKLGVKKLYILTGDSRGIGENVAQQVGVDEVYSELLPDQKVAKLEEIRDSAKIGNTVFIGDGINDAPAIAASDVGIAMGKAGSDATIAISDVVFMTDELSKLPELLGIAKKTRRKVLQNIILSLGTKLVVVLLSIIPTNFMLPLWLAIFSDVGVSLIAIFNSIFIFKKEK